jgi:hypothetical protein
MESSALRKAGSEDNINENIATCQRVQGEVLVTVPECAASFAIRLDI